MKKSFKTTLITLPLLYALVAASHATVIAYDAAGSTYSENFDSLANSGYQPTWTDGETIEGWFASVPKGNPPTYYVVNSGSSSPLGDLISAGTLESTDRTLAYQANGSSTASIIGVAFSNQTGAALDSVTVSYDGEQWRAIGGENPTILVFEYQIFASGAGSLNAASGWTAVSSLDFTTPVTSPTSVAVNGNEEGSVNISGTISELSWGEGEELWIRWSTSGANQRAIAGVDNFSLVTIPEAGSSTLMGLCAMSMLLIRKKRQLARR